MYVYYTAGRMLLRHDNLNDIIVETDKHIDFPIDLVYTWVDGDDPVWREKRNRYMPVQPASKRQQQSWTEARWRDNDELLFSLRSVERYASWVNHIYIVTDAQCPAWLNVNHPKITLVDHRDILPAEALPVFSSHAIESCIYKIPGLAEHFIIGNDDTFFGAPTTPEVFYNADGSPIVRVMGARMKPRKARSGGNYKRVLLHMQELVNQRWGKRIPYAPHHNFDAYRKSDFEYCVSLMPEAWERTSFARFRNNKDMQRCFVSYYLVATGQAELRKVSRYNRIYNPAALLKALVSGHYAADSRWIRLVNPDYQRVMDKYNPLMFCMNDSEYSTDDDRKRMAAFLEGLFPEKSMFEL